MLFPWIDSINVHGPSELSSSLNPVVWELLNCALSASSGVALLICIRYLVAMYWSERQFYQISRLRALWNLSNYKLAIGFTIFLMGEWPRATWAWWARYSVNHGISDVTWMGSWPWITLPILFGAVCIIGKACIIRALIPMAWGRYAYWAICGGAIAVLVASQYVRL